MEADKYGAGWFLNLGKTGSAAKDQSFILTLKAEPSRAPVMNFSSVLHFYLSFTWKDAFNMVYGQMVKTWNWGFRWKSCTPKGTFLPQILILKINWKKRAIIQGTLIMSVGSAIIRCTEKVRFLNLISRISGFYCSGNSSHCIAFSESISPSHTHTHTDTLKNVKHPLAARKAVKLKFKSSLSPQQSI